MFRGRKKHINFFNINFSAPTQIPPFWAPRKKFMCLISWERTQNFRGQKGGPKRAIFGHKKFFCLLLESQRPATRRRKPKSPKVPGRVLGRVPGKEDCWGDCWEQCLFSAFPRKPASQHCSQHSPQQSSFPRHFSQHSPRHFWGFGLSPSCSRSLGFQHSWHEWAPPRQNAACEPGEHPRSH